MDAMSGVILRMNATDGASTTPQSDKWPIFVNERFILPDEAH
jgi:hypothetical protein